MPKRNTSKHESAPERETIGHNSGHNRNVVRYGKQDARYWKPRVELFSRSVKGVEFVDDCYSVRIAFEGRRERFNTDQRDKAEAAKVAASIYKTLALHGWTRTMQEFKPGRGLRAGEGDSAGRIVGASVGQFLAAASAVCADVAPRTLNDYSRAFRQIVAQIHDVAADATRYGYRGTGTDRWRKTVESIPLASITPAAVQSWKGGFIAKAGNDPQAITRAKVTANSLMRKAKSLFSEKVLEFVRPRLELPDPLPFAKVEFFKKLRSHSRYQSNIDAGAILRAASVELVGPRVDEFKVIVLALCCGLRKNEIDKLTWPQVDLANHRIQIRTTAFFKAKSEDSNADVDVEPEIAALLREWKAASTTEFVVASHRRAIMGAKFSQYRCTPVFDAVGAWLKTKGVDDQKPLHTLRKEFGSIVADQHGIYAASRALRHADVQVTALHYLDKKKPIAIGLGQFLKPEPQKKAKKRKS